MKNTDMKNYRARRFDTFWNLLYVASFIALITILGHRNYEIDRWIYRQEMARKIMAEEEDSIELNEIEIRRISL